MPTFTVGGRCLACAPADDGDERWVPGRVLAERTARGGREIGSLDGYDSETDEWVDEEAIAGGALREYDAGGDAKAAAKRDLAGDAARRHAEQRKLDGRQGTRSPAARRRRPRRERHDARFTLY